MKTPVLSKRLSKVVDMVSKDSRVCDVGCDHGFVSICLILEGISPCVLAMDVRTGPLSAAEEHVREAGLENVIQTRLSDGLHNYEIGEADTLICAGMGGKLIMRILSEDKKKTQSFKEIILQPQSELEQCREYLYTEGYSIEQEEMVEEDGKYYPMMRVIPKCDDDKNYLLGKDMNGKLDEERLRRMSFRYGALLLRQQSTVLYRFLEREERIYGEILEHLKSRGLEGEKRRARYEEMEERLYVCREAIALMRQPKHFA